MRTRAALLAASLLWASASVPASAEVNFDDFLAGFDNACKESPQFEAFRSSLIDKYGSIEGVKAGAPPMPSGVGSAIGPIKAADRGDYHEIMMPVDGTFRGLKLARFVFLIGKSNGINGYRLEFAEPPARLRAVLGPAVARGKKIMKAEDQIDSGQSTGFDFSKGISAAFCDFSN